MGGAAGAAHPTTLPTTERTDMVTQQHGAPEDSKDETSEKGVDPRATDHATGSEQAAENEDTESPS